LLETLDNFTAASTLIAEQSGSINLWQNPELKLFNIQEQYKIPSARLPTHGAQFTGIMFQKIWEHCIHINLQLPPDKGVDLDILPFLSF
jgi:hypothetical protein